MKPKHGFILAIACCFVFGAISYALAVYVLTEFEHVPPNLPNMLATGGCLMGLGIGHSIYEALTHKPNQDGGN